MSETSAKITISVNENSMDETGVSDAVHGSRSDLPRTLNDDEYKCLYGEEYQERQQVPAFKQYQYEQNAKKYWDQFYKRNASNFFKDRHWTLREFQFETNDKRTLFEVGCGVGNFLFPLLSELPNLFIYACDFSAAAIDLLRQNSQYDSSRLQSFVHDLTVDDEFPLEENSIDICSMIFVLSAINPEKMSRVLEKIFRVTLFSLAPNTNLNYNSSFNSRS